MPHLALLYTDGRVVDMSLYENLSPSRNELLKLSKDEAYLGFSDQFGYLYLISSSISRPITKVNPGFGHNTIPNSVGNKEANKRDKTGLLFPLKRYKEGMQLGKKFWIWGRSTKGT